MFNIIKIYYNKGIYDKSAVKVFVGAGRITQAQYEEIVGEGYLA